LQGAEQVHEKKVLNGHPKRWAQDMHICEQAKPTSHAINRMSLGDS
jgi:hypothetical protein